MSEYWNIDIRIVENKQDFENTDLFKINYSGSKEISSDLNILPSGLLGENTIKSHFPQMATGEGVPRLYVKESTMGYDPFSAMFFMLSRYEEYIHKDRDHHGRFPAKSSIAYNNNVLQMPLVDIWMFDLAVHIKRNSGPDLYPDSARAKIIPSFDLDNAYAYRGKGMLRNIGGVGKDLAAGKMSYAKRRIDSLIGKQTDPYDSYDYIESKIQGLDAYFFIPVGDRAQLDKNLPHTSVHLKQLVNRLSANWTVGIHPSYASNKDQKLLAKELERMKELSGNDIHHSRQHYLKLEIPDTYNKLLEQGVTHDYSMGFADANGYRAGIARAFRFYDLSKEKTTDLIVHPFMYMDGTYKDYMKCILPEAIAEMKAIKRMCRKFGGEFMFIWHNDSLSNYGRWEGWQELFEESLKWD